MVSGELVEVCIGRRKMRGTGLVHRSLLGGNTEASPTLGVHASSQLS